MSGPKADPRAAQSTPRPALRVRIRAIASARAHCCPAQGQSQGRALRSLAQGAALLRGGSRVRHRAGPCASSSASASAL